VRSSMRRHLDGGLWEVESGGQLSPPRSGHVVLAVELSFKSRQLISRERRPVPATLHRTTSSHTTTFSIPRQQFHRHFLVADVRRMLTTCHWKVRRVMGMLYKEVPDLTGVSL